MVDWGNLLMRVRGLNEVKVKPIIKVDVHAPIFYFPKILQGLNILY